MSLSTKGTTVPSYDFQLNIKAFDNALISAQNQASSFVQSLKPHVVALENAQKLSQTLDSMSSALSLPLVVQNVMNGDSVNTKEILEAMAFVAKHYHTQTQAQSLNQVRRNYFFIMEYAKQSLQCYLWNSLNESNKDSRSSNVDRTVQLPKLPELQLSATPLQQAGEIFRALMEHPLEFESTLAMAVATLVEVINSYAKRIYLQAVNNVSEKMGELFHRTQTLPNASDLFRYPADGSHPSVQTLRQLRRTFLYLIKEYFPHLLSAERSSRNDAGQSNAGRSTLIEQSAVKWICSSLVGGLLKGAKHQIKSTLRSMAQDGGIAPHYTILLGYDLCKEFEQWESGFESLTSNQRVCIPEDLQRIATRMVSSTKRQTAQTLGLLRDFSGVVSVDELIQGMRIPLQCTAAMLALVGIVLSPHEETLWRQHHPTALSLDSVINTAVVRGRWLPLPDGITHTLTHHFLTLISHISQKSFGLQGIMKHSSELSMIPAEDLIYSLLDSHLYDIRSMGEAALIHFSMDSDPTPRDQFDRISTLNASLYGDGSQTASVFSRMTTQTTKSKRSFFNRRKKMIQTAINESPSFAATLFIANSLSSVQCLIQTFSDKTHCIRQSDKATLFERIQTELKDSISEYVAWWMEALPPLTGDPVLQRINDSTKRKLAKKERNALKKWFDQFTIGTRTRFAQSHLHTVSNHELRESFRYALCHELSQYMKTIEQWIKGRRWSETPSKYYPETLESLCKRINSQLLDSDDLLLRSV